MKLAQDETRTMARNNAAPPIERALGVDKSWREPAGIPLVELHC
jgi:hypothetical protein